MKAERNPRYTPDEQKSLASIMRQQMGGNMAVLMIGAKNHFCGEDEHGQVWYKFNHMKGLNGCNLIKITLTIHDTYRVESWKTLLSDAKLLGQTDDIYCDQLRTTIERMTGLYLKL